MAQPKSRKNTAGGRRRAKSRSGIITAAILVVFAIALFVLASLSKTPNGSLSANGSNKTKTVKDSDLVIHADDITDQVSFFPVEVKGIKLEVLAARASDGSVRTAFNTCQVCYNSGKGYYIQEGNNLVCQNCGNRFKIDEVEVVRGGCNPVPITSGNKTVDDTTITIPKEFLEQASVIFSNWKR